MCFGHIGFTPLNAKKNPAYAGFGYGGERGIRTLDTLLTYTPLAGARLQPLGHLSSIGCLIFLPVFQFIPGIDKDRPKPQKEP